MSEDLSCNGLTRNINPLPLILDQYALSCEGLNSMSMGAWLSAHISAPQLHRLHGVSCYLRFRNVPHLAHLLCTCKGLLASASFLLLIKRSGSDNNIVKRGELQK